MKLSKGQIVAIGATLIVGGLVIIGGSSSPALAPPQATQQPQPQAETAAYLLAQMDTGSKPAASLVVVYQKKLDQLQSVCTEDEGKVGGIADAIHSDLAKYGIVESRAEALDHLRASIPAGAKMNCQAVAAAYLVLREPKQ